MAKTFDQTTVSVATLNAIRDNASPLYQEFVPQATRNNIGDIGEALWQFDPTFNEFTNLLSKIALTMTIKRLYENKLARFKSGSLHTANMIEEYYLHKIPSGLQDPTGANPLGRRTLGMSVAYYRENRNETYATTVSFKQIRNAFRSADGVEKLMNEIVEELYNSSNIDEYEIMKNLLAQVYGKATIYEVPEVATSSVNARRFVKTVRKASNDMEEPTNEFHTHFIVDPQNPSGDDYVRNPDIINFTPKGNQVLFINKDVEAEVSVEVLASAFNRGDVANPIQQVIVGDFGDEATGIVGMLADDRLLRVFDTFRELMTQTNAQGAFINYFLHIDQVLALSPFANVIVFKTEDNSTASQTENNSTVFKTEDNSTGLKTEDK